MGTAWTNAVFDVSACRFHPKQKLDQWARERETWLENHPTPWDDKTKKEYQECFLERIERWSDQGYGACPMEKSSVRKIVEDALMFFNDERYDLDQYVIMPNHVHLLVTPRPSHRLADILHSWKSFTGNRVNARVGRRGELWMDERFDHIVRSIEHVNWYRRYIAENPAKAHLREGTYTLSLRRG